MFNGAVREIKKEPHTPCLTEMFLEIRQQLEVVELTLSLLLTLVRLSLRNPSDQFYANVGLSLHLGLLLSSLYPSATLHHLPCHGARFSKNVPD